MDNDCDETTWCGRNVKYILRDVEIGACDWLFLRFPGFLKGTRCGVRMHVVQRYLKIIQIRKS